MVNNTQPNTEDKKRPKLYAEQPVYVRSYTLLKELATCYSRIPRDIRYTLGTRMLNAMTDEVMCVTHAFKSAKGKDVFIREAILHLEETQVLLRLLKDVGAVSTKFFLHTLPISADISTQLNSWARYAERKEQTDSTKRKRESM
jgi:hypothetical protein